MKKFTCPICGYDSLDEPPYSENNQIPSWDICDCCGMEFGTCSKVYFDEYRKKWILDGSKWFLEKSKPKNWNLINQLENINLKLEDIIKKN